MTKPKLLRDITCYELGINSERIFILPANYAGRTIGRGEECDIQIYIPPENEQEEYKTLLRIALTVSREHAVIIHRKEHGLVYLVRKTKSPTSVIHEGVKNRIGLGEKRQLFVGNVLILGTGEYKMRLEETDVVALESYERRVRVDDTNTKDLTDEIISKKY